MKRRSAQASMEYLMLVGLFIAILSIVVYLSAQQIDDYVLGNEASDSAKTIARAVNHVSAIGPGTQKIVLIKAPQQAKQRYAAHKQIIFKQFVGGLTDYHHPTVAPVFGLIETGPGNKHVVLRVEENGYVSLSPLRYPSLYDGLVAYYNMDVLNGSHVLDASGNAPPAEIQGNAACGVDGYIGMGCSFEESGDRLLVASDASFNLQTYTYSYWIMLHTSFTGSWRMFLGRGDRRPGMWFYDNSNRLFLRHRLDNGDDAGANPTSHLQLHNWAHITFRSSWNGTHTVFTSFFNGVQEAESIHTFAPAFEVADLFIGNQNFTIDELKIWNRALSNDEISHMYAMGRLLE